MRKTIYLMFTILTTLMLVASTGLTSLAVTEQDKKNLQDKIDDAKSQLNDITESKDSAKSELETLTQKVSEAQNELEKVKAQLEDVKNQITEKETQINEEEKEIEAKNNLLKQRMVALYEAGDTSFLDVLFNSENLLDFFTNYSMIQQIVESDTDLINELEEKKQEVENLKAEQEVKNAQLRVLQETKQAEVNKLSEEEKKTQAEIDAYNKAMADVNKALAEAAKKAEEQIKNNTGGNGLKFDGSFIWPCNNKIVTSTVKKRWGRLHKGIDIGASYESVYASASGYAYNAYDRNGYGTYIMVFHGGNYVTLYGHLSTSKVRDGQFVKQGEVIATSGNSGGSTGAHLHFEIRQASNVSQFFSKSPLNPLDYLPGGYTLAPGATTES